MKQEEPEERFLVTNKRMNQNCGQKRMVFGGPKENEVRKALRRAIKAFGKVDLEEAHMKRQGHGSRTQVRCLSTDRICVTATDLSVYTRFAHRKKGCLSCMVAEHPLPR